MMLLLNYQRLQKPVSFSLGEQEENEELLMLVMPVNAEHLIAIFIYFAITIQQPPRCIGIFYFYELEKLDDAKTF